MSNNGLVATPTGTTAAPTLYEEIEQDDEVARGHVKVKEIIAYDFIERKKVIERDKVGNEIGSKMVIVENGRKPYFCQTKEQELIFLENNPGVREYNSNKVMIAGSGVRTESFSIQLLKSTAIKYMNDPRNVKEFTRKEKPVKNQAEKAVDAFNRALGKSESDLQGTAYLSTGEPKESFVAEEPVVAKGIDDTLISALGGEPMQTWRQQAKQLGIPLNKETGGSRKKEDVLTDLVAKLTQTTTSTS